MAVVVGVAVGSGVALARSTSRSAPGELWLVLEAPAEGELVMPADWIRHTNDPVVLHTAGGDVDLRAVARGPGTGSWDAAVDGAIVAHVRLERRPRGTEPVDTMSIAMVGPEGRGLTIDLEAFASPEAACTEEREARYLAFTDLSLAGIDWTPDIHAMCLQLVRGPPTVVMEAATSDIDSTGIVGKVSKIGSDQNRWRLLTRRAGVP